MAGASPPLAQGRVFVGRHWERSRSQATLDAALAGHGALVVLAGEAGIGKSTLATWIASRAADRGADVHWGRCWESGGAPAYWPWVQALRSLLSLRTATRGGESSGAMEASLVQLLPELEPMLPGTTPPAADLDPDAMRFRMFESVAAYLRRAAQQRPITIVLDDLHVADLPSLLLLDFLVADLASAPILLVVAYRSEEAPQVGPIAAQLAALSRHPGAVRIQLGNLTPVEVAEYVVLTLGEKSRAVGRRVFDASEGNPLFVREVVQMLSADHEAAPPAGLSGTVPEGARAVIGGRIARLRGETVSVLQLAAVLGREFDLDVLQAIARVGPERLLAQLDAPVRERIVIDVPEVAGRLRFSHALVRDVVYEGIQLPDRLRMHADAAGTLAQLHEGQAEVQAAEVAHHLLLAGALANVDDVIKYARRAGEHALRTLAYEEAVRHFHAALDAMRRHGGDASDRERCLLLLALGDAAARAGDEPRAKRAFARAAQIAQAHRYPQELATAALGYSGRFVWARAGQDRMIVTLLQRALDALDPGDSPLRVRLLARLAGALRDQVDPAPRDAVSGEALEMARRLGKPEALANALDGRCAALLWADNAAERIELADELVAVAEEHDLGEKAFQGHYYRALALMELGRIEEMKHELDLAEGVATELRQAPQRWLAAVTRATLALFEGRFADGERLVDAAQVLGEQAQASDAILSYRLQRYALAREQGTLSEAEPMLRRAVADYPARPMFRAALAHALTELGQTIEAQRLLRELAADPRRRLALTTEWPFTLGLLAETAAALGDRMAAESLYEALHPFDKLNAATSDEIALGSVARYLGLLAATLGRWQAAVGHLEEAVDANLRMGAVGWAAHARYDLAAALLGRRQAGDLDRAVELFREVGEDTSVIGMPVLERQARAQLARQAERGHGLRVATEAAIVTRPRLLFRIEGEYWTIGYGSDTIRLRHTIGLSHLARLLSTPGREVHALELAQSAAAGVESAIPQEAALPWLDEQAKAAYRGRLAELDEEIEEVERAADLERIARRWAEREALVQELARAVGMHGRDRKAAHASERARVSVTRAIRTAMKRIGDHSPDLADHLRRTIRTGTFCAYMPDPRVEADWET